jgi:hypothetical protein
LLSGKLVIHRIQFSDHANAAVLKPNEYRLAYDKGISDMKAYFSEMGIRADLVDEMMRYSSDEGHVLTRKQIDNFGLSQQNPYRYEQEKSRWIGRCGKDWWELKKIVDSQVKLKCGIAKIEDGNVVPDMSAMDKCIDGLMEPLYSNCGLKWPTLRSE